MKRLRVVYLCGLLLIGLLSKMAMASEDLLKLCKPLAPPLDGVYQTVQQVEVSWLVRGVLCYKASEAHWQLKKDEKELAIESLESLMHVTIALMPKHIQKTDADLLIESARDAIASLSYVPANLSGAVLTYASEPRTGAEVSVLFAQTGNVYTVITDENGLFQIDSIEEGGFVANVTTSEGDIGSAHASVVQKRPSNSVTIYVEQPGNASISGRVYVDGQTPGEDVMVFVEFPELSKEYATSIQPDGFYRFDNLSATGTFILSGLQASNGALGIEAHYIPDSTLEAEVDLYLDSPTKVNPEFLNPNFENGLDGWTHSENVKLVPTEDYFGD
ncbi:carboxypeptidase-like regulatory domain-containing protein [Vibrio ishigakensis]|uniref:carboxypeptidase-like regulatory domain-containing protein n=1 Tax=Vibrio ishigakensis TaxID=1481914 RepID=UPI0021C2E763|nr:carboxypeptidase-like regulatory domain-containing protein [Vibrio ishigakensis]